ncbi:hypothetical protein [Nitrobacter winogradskyi]|uniref:Uncharacterized protein n=2 Tax=Nitrobacter winogradskyi TaxID=913 RepID=A0ACC6AGK4_NITWI|nr:hypothetical protein [Nitrobacter winogradskyi]MCP1998811.1 hypothetical protein [Nitrobacter winogradskyi]GEC14267.1 hypothetical protein NWI01_01590 [Nitrobacter winogradskyi]
MKSPRADIIRVSDHALLRFVERAGGLDIEALRSALEGSLKRAVQAASDIGTGDLTIQADGLTYIVRNNVIVTILR